MRPSDATLSQSDYAALLDTEYNTAVKDISTTLTLLSLKVLDESRISAHTNHSEAAARVIRRVLRAVGELNLEGMVRCAAAADKAAALVPRTPLPVPRSVVVGRPVTPLPTSIERRLLLNVDTQKEET